MTGFRSVVWGFEIARAVPRFALLAPLWVAIACGDDDVPWPPEGTSTVPEAGAGGAAGESSQSPPGHDGGSGHTAPNPSDAGAGGSEDSSTPPDGSAGDDGGGGDPSGSGGAGAAPGTGGTPDQGEGGDSEEGGEGGDSEEGEGGAAGSYSTDPEGGTPGSGGAPGLGGSPGQGGFVWGTGGDSGDAGEAGAHDGGMHGGHDPGHGMGGEGGDSGEVDHCVVGFPPHPADATMSSEPWEWVSPTSGAIDLVEPQEVLDWLTNLRWQRAHDAWHNVRRCVRQPQLPECQVPEMIPEDQECENAQNGYEFLAMHRHMIIALKQVFPTNQHLFDGFERFPFEATDVPEQWRDRFGTGWSPQIRQTAEILENIENELDRFPTEGDLGDYIQCGLGNTGFGSIHGAMHFKWAVMDSPHSLGRQPVNIDNYMFWKLHGWIDDIWERYRIAKGIGPDDEALQAELIEQCHEMHALAEVFAPEEPEEPEEPELPEESGFFHEQVRPLFENETHRCSACHSESSPEAGMSLGGNISSADIVEGLVNQPSVYGGQFQLVVPGDPDNSWLYLKASGLSVTAGCTGDDCRTRMMPPGASTPGEDGAFSADELEILRQWIEDGAEGPP
ncbi:MAG TPA: hypothetical protein VKY73_24265 [Polyangiaceae bacterium]|nr:hypothetical protein [Polyangiaceae bacterium]